MKFKALASAVGFGLSLLAGTAIAGPIPVNGTVSVGGFFDSLSSAPNAIVSDLNTIDVFSSALYGGATGSFAPPINGAATATDFSIAPFVAGMIYQLNGFTFTVQSVSAINRTPLSCAADGSGCTDDLGFNIAGTVTGTGFLATAFTGSWTGNGSCQEIGTAIACDPASKSGSWSVSLTAVGRTVPEPGTLALIGLGLAGLALTRRRKV